MSSNINDAGAATANVLTDVPTKAKATRANRTNPPDLFFNYDNFHSVTKVTRHCVPLLEKKAPQICSAFFQSQSLFDNGLQFTALVTLEHKFQRVGLNFAGIAGGTKGFITCDTNFLHRLRGHCKVFTWVKLRFILRKEAANSA